MRFFKFVLSIFTITYFFTLFINNVNINNSECSIAPSNHNRLFNEYHEHDYVFDRFEWSESGTSAKAIYICQNDETHIEEYDADISFVEKTPATCTEKGIRTYIASYDGHESSNDVEDIEPLGHELDFEHMLWTWNEDRTSARAKITCKRCEHYVEVDSIKIDSFKVEPDCINPGSITYSATIIYKGINYTGEIVDEIDPLGHPWKEPIWTWDGYTKASAYFECDIDVNHNMTIETTNITKEEHSSTCTENGKIIYTAKLTYEGKEYVGQTEQILDAKNHDYKFDSFIWAEDGMSAKAKYICNNDNNHIIFYDSVITNEIIKKATCIEDGLIRFKASYDGHESFNDVIIDSLVHEYQLTGIVFSDDGKTAKAKLSCVHDANHVIYEDLIVTSSVTKKPTCDKFGITTYTAKYKNSVGSKEVEDISPLGHNYKFKEFVWDSDYKSAKAKYVCSNDSNHFIEYDAVVTSTVKTKPTCDVKGITSYTATYNGNSITVDVQDIKTLSHKLTKVEATTANANVEGNKEYYVCSDCNNWYYDKNGTKIIKNHEDVIIKRKNNFFEAYGILFPLVAFMFIFPIIFIKTKDPE
ncbi:MAG: hypothetical protein IJS83_06080 [Acholeplasmatales bacterium]|nr:hypothetical protein [Acholeplasmatales bacterium]